MNEEEQKNVRDIEAAKVWYDRAIVQLGDREPVYRHEADSMVHSWGFGDPTVSEGRQHMFHRVDGPAMYSDHPTLVGTGMWQVFGSLHRLDGPAFIDIHGSQEWWLYGVPMVSWRVYRQFTTCSEKELIFAILKNGEMRETKWNWHNMHRATLKEISTILNDNI